MAFTYPAPKTYGLQPPWQSGLFESVHWLEKKEERFFLEKGSLTFFPTTIGFEDLFVG